MTIEIRQLIIRAVVTETRAPLEHRSAEPRRPAAPAAQAAADVDRLVETCVERAVPLAVGQVMRRIARTQDR
jgi:predicted aminopeptidase